MDDGESFLMTDWNEAIRRVQFERKQTFDAGATPGLDDFERPELKSVSGDLVDELQHITDKEEKREDRINELQRQLQQRDERVRDLEQQLSDARDLKQMADRFSRAMMEQVTGRPLSVAPGRQSELDEAAEYALRRDPQLEAELDAVRNGEKERMSAPIPDAREEYTSTKQGSDDADDGETAPNGPDSSGRTENKEPNETNGSGEERERVPDVSSIFGSSDATESASHDESETYDSKSEPSTTASTMDPLVSRLRDEIDALDRTAIDMVRRYYHDGPMEPQEAHERAGGSGDRAPAYATNRVLRQRGMITHIGCGQYDYALAELVREELTDPIRPEDSPAKDYVESIVSAVETAFLGQSAAGTDTQGRSAEANAVSASAEPWPDA
jgi:hypothetical protein